MLKKSIVTGLIGVLVLGFMFGKDAVSYVTTSVGWVKDSIDEQVPVRFQIERVKKLINQIEPEVYRNKSLIVREEVAIERLAKRIESLQDTQAKEEKNIMRMKADLDGGDSHIYYAGIRYSQHQVKTDLSGRFHRFQTRDQERAHLNKQLVQQKKILENARVKLDEMLTKRNQLIAEVDKLEAQEKMLAVAKSASDIRFDDSRLSKVTQLVAEIEARLNTETRMLDSGELLTGSIPMDAPQEAENLTEAIADYFARPTADEQLVAEIDIDTQL